MAGIVLVFITKISSAQVQQFTVSVNDSATLLNVPAIHSYAFASYNNKWIFIGGRTNGLHGFTPPSGFVNSGINDTLFVYDPVNDIKIGINVFDEFTDTLLLNGLRAAFFQFTQRDSMLYITGGYGYTLDSSTYMTHPNLIAVNIKNLLDDVAANQPISQNFRMIQDSVFKVCGGNMYRLDTTFYLVFGHDFNNYYAVIDTLGFFTQHYTCEIRKFSINDDGVNLSISGYNAIHDSANFRRRDYNLVPQIFPDGTTGLTAFSGVFQYGIDYPYFNSINISPSGYDVINNFNQNLSQYNSGVMPVYDLAENKMSTVFFGGMSMYQLDSITGALLTDTLIPFVNTISKVVRFADSTMIEYSNPERMPELTGTNSQFIADANIPVLQEGIIDLNSLPLGTTFVGYLIGGITSTLPHVSNTPALSHAGNVVYKVYLNKYIDTYLFDHEVKNDINNLLAYPNPTGKSMTVEFEINKSDNVSLNIYSVEGQLISKIFNGYLSKGFHQFSYTAEKPGNYFVEIQTSGFTKAIHAVVR